jgi:hypothetical protein
MSWGACQFVKDETWGRDAASDESTPATVDDGDYT